MTPDGILAFVWTLLSVLYVVFIVRWVVLQKMRKVRPWSAIASDVILGVGLLSLTFEAYTMSWTAQRRRFYAKNLQLIAIPMLGMDFNDSIQQQKYTFGATLTYYTTVWAVKTSFLLYYFEFSRHLSKTLKAALYFMSGLISITYLLNMLMNALWCRPLSRLWAFLTPTEYCNPTESITLITMGAFTNIGTDILLMSFPIFVLSSLQINRRQRWAIGVLMLIGLLTISAATVRFALIYRFQKEKSTDPSDAGVFWEQVQITSGIEQWVGIIAACLPALRALLNRSWVPKTKSGSTPYEYRSGGSSGKRSGKKGGDTDLFETTHGSQTELQSADKWPSAAMNDHRV